METQIAQLNIRRIDPERDRTAIDRLVQLDSGTFPRGEMLGAEVEGRLLAAISLETGETMADPFARTSELRSMLELRARQSNGRRQRRGLRRSRARGIRTAPSPAGSLVSLPR